MILSIITTEVAPKIQETANMPLLITAITALTSIIVGYLTYLAKNNHKEDINTLKKGLTSTTESLKIIDSKVTHLSEVINDSQMKDAVRKSLSDVLTAALGYTNEAKVSDYIIFKSKEVNKWLEDLYTVGLSNADKHSVEAHINASYEIILSKGNELLGEEFMKLIEPISRLELHSTKKELFFIIDDIHNDKIRRVGLIVRNFLQKNLQYTINEYSRNFNTLNKKQVN